jgi:hypothetical protein
MTPFNNDTVDLIDLYEGLYCEHEEVEGMPCNCTLISPGERQHAYHAKHNVSIDPRYAQRDAISACPKLSINLLDRLHGCAAYLIWCHSLFGNKSGRSRMCLGVNGLALAPILLVKLLFLV